MREILTSCGIFLAGCLGALNVSAAEAPFEIECNFDLDSEFADGANLPEGWAQDGTPLRRASGEDYVLTNHSGDYILATASPKFDEVLYTPLVNLVAGKPCDLEFYYIAPGGTPDMIYNASLIIRAGTAQNKEAQTIMIKTNPTVATKNWTKHSYSFTPEADGEYCFSIEVAPYSPTFVMNCGAVGFDDFIISGTRNEGAPVGETLLFDFEDDSLFPGVSRIPKGWATSDSKPFLRNKVEDLQIPAAAPSGQWVLGNVGASTQQNHRLISPVWEMKAGVPATVQFKYYAATDNVQDGYGFNVYVAPAQDTDLPTPSRPQTDAILIGAVPEDVDRAKEWFTSEVFSYVPEEDGDFCFIITPANQYGQAPGGPVAFDDIAFTGVKEKSEEEPPTPPVPPTGKPVAFELECNFDVDTDFSDGANLPEGWLQDGTPLRRDSAWDYGLTNHSGDYILATASAKFDEVLYTPLMNLVAGKPCTIEFYYIAPGGTPDIVRNVHLIVKAGTAQNKEAQTILIKETPTMATKDWTKHTYTFTPETDGNYCFSIELAPYMESMAQQCGAVGFDDFIISGTCYAQEEGPDLDSLEPNEDNLADCKELPYRENFSDASHYDGESMLPMGWSTTGTVTWATANVAGLEGHSGDYYMIANHNTTAERDDKAYTPFFNLEADKEYTISYWAYIQGNDWNYEEILYLPELAFTVGTEQEADFHVTLDRFGERTTDWVKRSHTFTPKVSGAYCFGFMLTGPVNSGWVMIDDLKITSEGLISRVEPGFMPKGIYSMMNSGQVFFEGTPIKMVNTSKYADSYKWTATGAEPEESTEENPAFLFPESGTYTIVLEATNGRGTRTTQRKITVEKIDQKTDEYQALHLYSAGNDQLFDRGAVPTFSSDPEGDFITGYNHYYFDVAQRFEFSEKFPVKITQLSCRVADRRFRNQTAYYDDQRIKPFTLAFYGSNPDGSLDESNVLGKVETTIGEALGSSGLGGNVSDSRDIALPEPIEVKGTFYVAMHFDRGMEVVPQDASLGRSFIATAAIRHGHGQTTLYCKPIDKPDLSNAELGKWCTVDALDLKQQGMGAYWILWGTAYDESAGVQAIGPDGTIEFAATFMDDDLCVSGCEDGQKISVYTVGGARVATATAVAGTTTLRLPHLAAGVYVVACDGNVTKIVKR